MKFSVEIFDTVTGDSVMTFSPVSASGVKVLVEALTDGRVAHVTMLPKKGAKE